MPDWEKRFRAPRVSLPDWAEDAPRPVPVRVERDRDVRAVRVGPGDGRAAPGTDRPNGTTDGVLAPDGEWIWWFADKDGDEFGDLDAAALRRAATAGGRPTSPALRARPLLPGRASRSAGTARRSSDGRPTRTARRSTSSGRRGARRDLPAPGVGRGRGPVARRLAASRSSTPSTATRCTRRCGCCGWTARRWRSWTTPRAARTSWASKCWASRRSRGTAGCSSDISGAVAGSRWCGTRLTGEETELADRAAGRRQRRVVPGRFRAAGRAQLRGPQRAVAVRPGGPGA